MSKVTISQIIKEVDENHGSSSFPEHYFRDANFRQSLISKGMKLMSSGDKVAVYRIHGHTHMVVADGFQSEFMPLEVAVGLAKDMASRKSGMECYVVRVEKKIKSDIVVSITNY